MNEAYICDSIRTPIGAYGGLLATVRTDDLAAVTIRALMQRNPNVDWEAVDDVLLGCANQAGEDNRNVARMALLLAGMPRNVPGCTVNRLCASGLNAVGSAARVIQAGEADLVVAGGVESMSRAPFVIGKAGSAFSRNAEIFDTTIGWRFVNKRMEALYGVDSMPQTAENVAAEFNISREDQDRFALWSQSKTAQAKSDGRLAEDGRLVGHALRRLVAGDLAGLFDGPSTVAFDPSLPMISLDLSRVTENSTLISVLMTCSSAWMESALLDPNGGQRWVIYDEAWRLMSHPALLRRMDAHWRLARHYGIANMLIFHKLTDLDNVGDQGSAMRSLANSLLANAETRIVYRQESDQLGPTATALGLTGTEQQLLPNLGVGQGLWRIKARSFVCQHQLHPDELALFDTSSRAAGGHR